jgi:diacylglycerol kinase family enzyme
MPITAPSPNAPLFIVLNAGSGREETEQQRSTIEQALVQAGRPFELSVIEDPAQLEATATRMVEAALAAGGIVVAAGGDGTINTVAGKAVGRAHGIPEDLAEAVQALLGARMQPVQVGMVNQRIFLVNASIGLYPEVLEEREQDKKQFGRSRIVALFSMLKTALGAQQYLRISMDVEGRTKVLRTSTLFVGNNRLQMSQLGMDTLEDGKLAAIAPKPVGRLGMLKLLALGAMGRLGQAGELVEFAFREMTVKQRTLYGQRRKIKVATDGEVAMLDTPLRFRVLENSLLLMKREAGAQLERDAA